MIAGLILLAFAAYFWFGMAKDASDESATGFVMIWKKLFGLRGYVITVKACAVVLFLAAFAEFGKYFF